MAVVVCVLLLGGCTVARVNSAILGDVRDSLPTANLESSAPSSLSLFEGTC